MTTVTIVRPTLADKPAWRRLYDGYAAFYRRSMNDAKANLVWSWIHDPNHPVECLLARTAEGTIVALAHVHEYPRPLLGGLGGYLDDIFVDPAFRGSGIVDKLFAALAELAAERGWLSVQWKTAEDNYRARSVYDRVGRKTHWITYEMDPAPPAAAAGKKPVA
ncbi:MAG: GNAT family N-acetyltransferase [Alphaproteobacteria bacterium]|nr:GNAT family N-acetyltransferase [Alphaproteobacteria bacterium]